MTIEVELPDGSVVEFPDGTSPKTMEMALARYRQQPAAAPSAPQGRAYTPTQQAAQARRAAMTPQQREAAAQQEAEAYQAAIAANQRGRQIGRDVALTGRSILRGVASIPDIIVSPLTSLVNYLGEKPATTQSLINGQPERRFPRQMTATESADYFADVLGAPRPETAQERILSDITGAIASVPVGAGIGSQLSRATSPVVSGIGRTLMERPGLQAVTAATGAGAAGGAREAGAGPGVQFGAGLLGGALPALATARPPRLPSTPEGRQLVTQAERMGIPLRPAGVEPGKVTTALRGVPGAGAAKRYEADVVKANDALAEIIGAPRGTPPARVYAEAATRNAAEYDDFARNYALTLDASLLRKLTDFRNAAPELGGPPQAAKNAVDQFLNEASQIGSAYVPGDLFKRLDTELGGVQGARDLQAALRSKFKAGMPAEDAKRWDALQRRYGDMKTVERLYANLPKTGGVVDPRTILTRINATKRGAASMAKGTRGPLGELAKVGQAIVPPPRMGISNVGLPAAATAGGGLGLGLPGAAGGYTLANVLARLSDRPYTTQGIGRMEQLRAATPGLLYGVNQEEPQRQRGLLPAFLLPYVEQ